MTQTQDLHDLRLGSIEDGCRHLGEILGLEGPVAPDVLISALRSQEYSHNLLTCRGAPEFMAMLLDAPPHRYAQAQSQDSADLLRSVAGAMVRWGKVGFSVASGASIEARLRACLACPDLQRRESRAMLYDLLGTQAVCGLCGCDVEKKARLNSERCPGLDASDPSRNRWGQAL